MNKASVLKFEYRILPSGEFVELPFTGFSGTISKKIDETVAGDVHGTTVELRKAKIEPATMDLLDGILGRKLQCRVTDGNEYVHLFGTDNYPARLKYGYSVDGTPGGWNGYEVLVAHKSPSSYVIT
jgi:hypothetical protein